MPDQPYISTVQHKRGIAEDIAAHNPVLAEGEFGVETDTFQIKVGDGETAWNDLPYVGKGLRVDTLSNLQTDNPSLSPKEIALGYNPSYSADSATGQYVFKINQSTTTPEGWNSATAVPLVPSNIVGITGAARITNIVSITAAQYAGLATKNASTLYIIVD